ncbi:MAG: retropepsin-like aspartic protease [bacterium]
MSIITRKIELTGSKGNAKVVALFDSGASFSCVSPELANELGVVDPLPQPFDLTIAEIGKKLSVKDFIHLQFRINGYRLTDEFVVVPNLSEEAIIGAVTLQKWRIKLDFEHDAVIIDPQVTKLRL